MKETNENLFKRLKAFLPEDAIQGIDLSTNRYIRTNQLEKNVLKNAKIHLKLPCYENKFIYCVKFNYDYFIVLPHYNIDITFQSRFLVDNKDKKGIFYRENAGLLTLLWSDDFPIFGLNNNELKYKLANEIFVTEKEFTADQLKPYFSELDVWRIDKNYEINENLLYSLYINYLCFQDKPFYLNFTPETLEVIQELCEVDSNLVLGESLYLALSSTHWRHAFLELYKCIENIYAFSYLRELYNFYDNTISFKKIYRSFDEILNWYPKEEDAIIKLLKSTQLRAYCNDFALSLGDFDIGEETDLHKILAKRIYKLRNSIAHWRFLRSISNEELDYQQIIFYTCELILDLYTSYKRELTSILSIA